MEWGIAYTAELGFARQVGKELFLAADSFRMGSARGSGESAGVGLVRPWSGADSRLCGAGAALERRGFRPVWGWRGFRAEWVFACVGSAGLGSGASGKVGV